MDKAIACIGSRTTPTEYLNKVTYLSKRLSKKYFIRTGGAIGADQAAMMGAKNRALVYQPWPDYEREAISFNNNIIAMTSPSNRAIEIAKGLHPNWKACSRGAQLLHGRNAHIILGKDLNSPVEFVICYSEIEVMNGILCEKGGTALGCDIARKYEIPVYNLKIYSPEEILEFINIKSDYKFES